MRAMRFAAGVHSGLAAGGPERPSTLFPAPEEEVSVESLLLYIKRLMLKHAVLRGALLHIGLVLAVIFMCQFVYAVPPSARRAAQQLSSALLAPVESSVEDAASVYAAIAFVSTTLYNTRSTPIGHSGPIAVASIALRQYRSHTRTIPNSSAAFPGIWMASSCPPLPGSNFVVLDETTKWNLGLATAASEAPTSVFEGANYSVFTSTTASQEWQRRTAGDNVTAFRGPTFATKWHWYSHEQPHFILGPWCWSDAVDTKAGRSNSIADAIGAVAQQSWLDDATRVVAIDALLADVQSSSFLHVMFVLEQAANGVVESHVYVTAFKVATFARSFSTLDVYAIAELVVEVLVMLFAMACATHTVYRARIELRVLQSVGFWVIYDAFLLSATLGLVVAQWVALSQSQEAVDAGQRHAAGAVNDCAMSSDTLSAASVFASYQWTLQKLRGWVALFTCLRGFLFLQYIPRLAIVTETARGALSDLVGVVVLIFLFVFTYSVATTLILGPKVPGFATISVSYELLIRLFGSGQLDPSDAEYFNEKDSSMSLMLIAYLAMGVLLWVNVVVNILASSFVFASETFNLVFRVDWSLSALVRDLRTLWRRMGASDNVINERLFRVISVLEMNMRTRSLNTAAPGAPSAPSRPGDARSRPGDARSVAAPGVAAATGGDAAGGLATGSTPASAPAPPLPQHGAEDGDNPDSGARGGYQPTRLRQTMTLRQLRRLCGDVLPAGQADVLFRKAQEQRGTTNGKMRNLNLQRRQLDREVETVEAVSKQLVMLEQVKEQLTAAHQRSKQGGREGDDKRSRRRRVPRDEHEEQAEGGGGTGDHRTGARDDDDEDDSDVSSNDSDEGGLGSATLPTKKLLELATVVEEAVDGVLKKSAGDLSSMRALSDMVVLLEQRANADVASYLKDNI